MALGFVGYTQTLGRKRVVVSNNLEASQHDSTSVAPLKRQCSGRMIERSRLESLPMDVLIRLLCGVDHEDLKQLFHVSKTIREATVTAKQFHFEYSTPKKNTFPFRSSIDMVEGDEFLEIETPIAPLRKAKPRLCGRKLADISVALFT